MQFTATAEHSGGASVGHPCAKGIFRDPTDLWQIEVEGDSLKQAHDKAHAQLAKIVADAQPCDCQRKLQAGANSWWNSVTIDLWPTDRAAMDAWLADGGDPANDPYGLIPSELKEPTE